MPGLRVLVVDLSGSLAVANDLLVQLGDLFVLALVEEHFLIDL